MEYGDDYDDDDDDNNYLPHHYNLDDDMHMDCTRCEATHTFSNLFLCSNCEDFVCSNCHRECSACHEQHCKRCWKLTAVVCKFCKGKSRQCHFDKYHLKCIARYVKRTRDAATYTALALRPVLGKDVARKIAIIVWRSRFHL